MGRIQVFEGGGAKEKYHNMYFRFGLMRRKNKIAQKNGGRAIKAKEKKRKMTETKKYVNLQALED